MWWVKVALQGGVELGAVDDHVGISVIGHFLQGEGVADMYRASCLRPAASAAFTRTRLWTENYS